MTGNLGQFESDWWRPVSESSLLLTEAIHEVGAGGSQRFDEHSLFLPIVGKRMMQEVAQGQPNGLAAFDNGADDVGGQEGIADCLAHAVRWDGVFGCNLLIGFACFDSVEPGEADFEFDVLFAPYEQQIGHAFGVPRQPSTLPGCKLHWRTWRQNDACSKYG